MRGSVCVRVWYLAEGDVLPGGERVVSVQRDPALCRVAVVTSDGARRTLYREDRLVVARRAVPDPAGWIARHRDRHRLAPAIRAG